MRGASALLLASLLVTACDARAGSVANEQARPVKPALTGRVIDEANILSDTAEAELIQASAALEQRRTDQFVVVTLPSLKGRTIEQTGLALGRGWGIGQRGKNNGVLLLVAPDERKVRIEVGYGLEPYLTNREASAIIDQTIVPFYSSGEMEKGTLAGARAIIAELDRSPLVEARQ